MAHDIAQSDQIKSCTNCGRSFAKDEDFLRNTNRWRLCKQGHLWFNCSCNSTLMIPKGKFPWYNPALNMRPETASVFNRLAIKEKMPYFSTAVMEIQKVLANSNSSTTEIAKAVRIDPLLAAEIIKMADTMKIGSEQQITTLEHAIVYIGRVSLGELVTLASMKQFTFNTVHFKSALYWEKSLLNGIVSEQIARRFNPKLDPEQVYLAGALCNLGKILGAIVLPQETDRVFLEISNIKTLSSWLQAEKKLKVTEHRILGEIASVMWGLPEYIRDAAMSHHGLPKIGQPNPLQNVYDAVAFGNQIAHWLMGEPHLIEQEIMQSYAQRLGLSPEDIDRIVGELIPLRESLRKILASKVDAA